MFGHEHIRKSVQLHNVMVTFQRCLHLPSTLLMSNASKFSQDSSRKALPGIDDRWMKCNRWQMDEMQYVVYWSVSSESWSILAIFILRTALMFRRLDQQWMSGFLTTIRELLHVYFYWSVTQLQSSEYPVCSIDQLNTWLTERLSVNA